MFSEPPQMHSSDNGLAGTTASARVLAWLGTAGVLVLLAWMSAADGGYFAREFLTAAVAGWTLVGLIIITGWEQLKIRADFAWPLAMLLAIFLWTGLSAFWSIGPDSSLMEFSRVSIYLTGFAAVLTGACNRRDIMISAGLFVALVTALAAFALLAKISPAYSQAYTFSGGRLMGSLGYWNGLAILMVLGILPCLWLASSREIPGAWRVAATVCLSLMCITLFFTLSRGGIFTGIFVLAAYLALAPRRLGLLLTLTAAGLPAALLAWRTFTALPTLHAAEEEFAIDPGEGRQFAYLLVATLAGAALLKTAALFLPDRIPPTRRGIGSAAAILALIVIAAASLGLSQRDWISSKLDQFGSAANIQTSLEGSVSRDARGIARLASTTDQRTELWKIGIENFGEHPVLGTGAGTYHFVNLRLQSGIGMARDPHSIWVRFLSDQGIIGFTLLLGFLVTLGVGLIAPLRSSRALRRDGLYLSLILALVAWIADSSLEWNWALPATGLVFFLIGGLALRLAAASGDDETASLDEGYLGFPAWARLAVMMAAVTLSIVFMAFLVSIIIEDRGQERLLAGDLAGAETAASRAHTLNRFSTDPIVLQAQIAAARGDYQAARDFLIDATRLEPQQAALYQRLALVQFYGLGNTVAGLASLERAIDLDPQMRAYHLLLHRLVYDQETFNRTGRMPLAPATGDS